MSYGGRGQGYGRSNPYDQQGGNQYSTSQARTQGAYGGVPQHNPYNNPFDEEQAMGGRAYDSDVEMAPLNGQAGDYGQPAGKDPNAILNECREVGRGIDSIEGNLRELERLQRTALNDPDWSPNADSNRRLDALNDDTMLLYRNFAARIKKIKSQPESGSPRNAPQVGVVDRRLKQAINQFRNVEMEFRKRVQAQMERQYRIVRPDATDAEVREACEDTSNQQVFSQALLQSDRRGQAQSVLRQVEDRHVAIQKIEAQMIELAQLFEDMERMVVEQEAAIVQTEVKGEEVHENITKGNDEMVGAIDKARAKNRKKWWCLLICLLIIIVIVVIVVIVVKTK